MLNCELRVKFRLPKNMYDSIDQIKKKDSGVSAGAQLAGDGGGRGRPPVPFFENRENVP